MNTMEQYYRHFRNRKIYRFVTFAKIESTEEEAVVYQAMYGERRFWIRPKSNFFEDVLHEGKMVPRFQPVTIEEIKEELQTNLSDADIRVNENSRRLKEVQEAVEQGWLAIDMLKGQLDNIGKLEKYYAEGWQADFEADERGEIGKGTDRSVLGEDTLYNLLDDIQELLSSFSAMAAQASASASA